MSINLYEIHVQSAQLNEIKKFLSFWLSNTHGQMPAIQEEEKKPYFDPFRNKKPSYFAVSTLHNGWVTIFHNSYEPQLELANTLSQEFSATVIGAIGQSTVDTYTLSVHQEGRVIRLLHSGEDTDGFKHEGEPFPFEKAMLAQFENETHFFDYTSMENFCKHFGIDIFADFDRSPQSWTTIQAGNHAGSGKDTFFKSLLSKLRGK